MSLKTAPVLLAARRLDPFHELRSRLESVGVQVVTAVTTGEALDRLREESPHLALLNHDLDPNSAASLMITMRHSVPAPEILLLSDGPPEAEEMIRASLGLLYYGVKPDDPGVLFDLITTTLKSKHLQFSAPARESPLVMCVDDDTLQLSALNRILTRHGYRVLSCESPVRAMSSLHEMQPDAAIVDIMLPGSSGIELVEKLRRRSGGRIPVVMLTALNSDASRKAARDRGVVRYLTKPCPDREVLEAVESSLAESER